MDKSAAAVRLAFLIGPLAASILALRLFGEDLNAAFGRLLAGRKYELHDRGAFRIFSLRGSDYHEFAARTLASFTEAMIRRHGEGLRLKAPDPASSRVTVHLLASREDLQERGFTTAHADLKNNGGYFQPVKMEIALLVSYADKETTADRRALQHEMTHALMHLAGPQASWSAWLAEGMAEYFENSRPEQDPPVLGGRWQAHVDELLAHSRDGGGIALSDILGFRPEDFRGDGNRVAYRAAHLLVTFLMESPAYRERFYAYFREELKDGPVAPGAFALIMGDPSGVERDWRAWLK